MRKLEKEDLILMGMLTVALVVNVIIIWLQVVRELEKEDLALLVQFFSGTSKVPLEGFKALQVGTGLLHALLVHSRAAGSVLTTHTPWQGNWVVMEYMFTCSFRLLLGTC